MRKAGANLRCVARGSAMHARDVMKPTPNEGARRCAPRAIFPAKARGDDRVEVRRARVSYNIIMAL